MISCCVLLTSLINAAIPSASGCAAAVGATLIPLMIRSGITPAGAAAAILAGTYGSNFNPGGAHQVMISGMAGIGPMEFVIMNAHIYAVLCVVGAVVVTLVEFVLKDHKGTGQMGDIQTDASGGIDRVNIFSPLLRLFR